MIPIFSIVGHPELFTYGAAVFGLQAVVLVIVWYLLREARDKALLEYKLPGYSFGVITLILLLFGIAVLPLMFVDALYLLIGSGVLLLVSLILGFWLGSSVKQ